MERNDRVVLFDGVKESICMKGSLRFLSWLGCGWALEMEGGAVRWNGMSVDGFDGVKESVCMKGSLRLLSWLGCGWAPEMEGMEWNGRCGGDGWFERIVEVVVVVMVWLGS